jgi:PKD repeat protein
MKVKLCDRKKISILFLVSLFIFCVATVGRLYTGPESNQKVDITEIVTTSSTETILYVDPASIVDPALTAGSTFTVNINVSDVEDLYAWQVNITWHAPLLNLTKITFGDFLADQPEGTVKFQRINQTAGWALFGESTKGKYPGVSGSGWLATLEFLVEDTGETILDIDHPMTYLLDSNLEDIPCEKENGYFSNLEKVHDIAIINVTASPTKVFIGQTVYINVTIINEGDFGESFNVTTYYDNVEVYTIKDVILDAKTNTTLTFTWDTTNVHEGNYTIKANATIVEDEEDIADNTFTDGIIAIISPPTVVAVDPSVTTANPGENFTIDINISNVEDLYAWGLKVGWKPAELLSVVDVKEGSFLKSGGETTFTFSIEYNYVDIGCSLLGDVPGVSGSGTLVSITFKVETAGNSTLNLFDVTLLDPDLNVIEDWDYKDSPDDGYFYTTTPVVKPVSDPPYKNYYYTPNPTQYGHPIANETLTFNASACYDPDQPFKDQTGTGIVSYQWDFGDGNITTVEDPIIYHTYTENGTYHATLTITDDDQETNTETFTIVVKLHDIAIINLAVFPTEVYAGDTVTINATILNEGTETETFNVTVFYDVHQIETKMEDLKPGEKITMIFMWNTSDVAPDTYTIWANACLVDPLNPEISLANLEQEIEDNVFIDGTVTVSQVPIHDLAIVDVAVSSTEVYTGEFVFINVTVLNKGNMDETFNASVYYNSSLIETKFNIALSAGDNVTLTFTWNTTGIAEGTYIISGEVSVVPGETNTDDNTFTDIKVIVSAKKPPVASFTYSPSEPVVNDIVTFNASASYDPDGGAIVFYEWNFGDGNITTVSEPIITHVYTTAGDFNVTLTVTDDDDQIGTLTKTITIGKLSSTITISAFPTNITIGDNITISGSITPERPGVTVTIWFRLTSEETWSTLANVTTDENSEYSYVWEPSEIGTYELKASWEGDEITLSAESTIITVDVLPLLVHDIAIIDVTASPTTVIPGDVVYVNVTVSNEGNFTETFNVTIYYNDTAIETQTVTELASGYETTIVFLWNTTDVAEGTYVISAVADVVVGEEDTADNTYINGKVTITTAVMLSAKVDLDPDTLNLNSKGKWISCSIELLESYKAEDIDVSTVLLDGVIPADWGTAEGNIMMVKFERFKVIQYMRNVLGITKGEVTLTVTGQLFDGTPFEGSDTIMVISEGVESTRTPELSVVAIDAARIRTISSVLFASEKASRKMTVILPT